MPRLVGFGAFAALPEEQISEKISRRILCGEASRAARCQAMRVTRTRPPIVVALLATSGVVYAACTRPPQLAASYLNLPPFCLSALISSTRSWCGNSLGGSYCSLKIMPIRF
jgi:hypothetical protein